MACVPSWPRSATEARGGAERERGWRGCRSTCTLHGHIPPNECTRHVRGILCSPPPPPPPPLPPPPLLPPLSPLQPSPPLPPTRESAATPNRPTSARAHLSPLTPATLLPSPLSYSSSSVLHPSSFTHPSLFPFHVPVAPRATSLFRLFSPTSEQPAGHHPTESRSSPFSRAAVLNVLHSSQREQTRAGPQEAAWAVLPRLPEPSAPGAVPGFRLLLRACGRTLHPRLVRTTNPPVRESSPAPATCLSLSLSLSLLVSLSVSLPSLFTRPLPHSVSLAFAPFSSLHLSPPPPPLSLSLSVSLSLLFATSLFLLLPV